jgi:hypothetical protein
VAIQLNARMSLCQTARGTEARRQSSGAGIMTLEEIPNLAGTDEDVARWIWHNLVPESGQASSLQGELLRAVEKLRWEAQSNGNINWDDQFEMFLDFLDDHLQREPRFSSDIRASIASDLGRLRNFLPVREIVDESDAGKLPYVDDDLYDRLASHVVRFCRLNPRLILHHHNPEQYR